MVTQSALEPVDRTVVEIISGLVEQQQLRRGGQGGRQRQPPPLPAGQRAQQSIPVQAG
ncbi:hypothetical protein VMT65_12445 [Nocardia sp. CDC153]|nr:hypothetical protein [Nocardia sp. CDC153]MEC3953840.1 hypothetical protein [Nocardia sp. CDC153]